MGTIARFSARDQPFLVKFKTLTPADSSWPRALSEHLGQDAPLSLSLQGNPELLASTPLALLCSRKCSGRLILQTYDFAQSLRDQGIAVIGGFHSPMEQECLRLLLRGKQPVLICPARNLPQRIPPDWKRPLDEGRLLILSAFSDSVRRITRETAHQRNRVVAALSSRVFVPYASPGGDTEALCREIVAWDLPLFTLPDPANQHLVSLGARNSDPLARRSA